MLLLMLALLVGLLAGALLTRRAAERRARSQWRTAALASLTDVSAADLKQIIGHLPPWVRDAEFQKVAWLNTLLRQLWPHIDKHVTTVVYAKAKEQLGALQLGKFGVRSVTLEHVSLGPPLKLGGIKVWDSDGDALVLDVDIRIAGSEPNAVVRVCMKGVPDIVVQVAGLQLHTTARVTLAPLLSAPPFFGAVSVALLGVPFVDFSINGLQGDLMAFPGLEAGIASGLKKALAAYIWPRRMVVPLVPDPTGNGYPALLPRAQGVLLLRVKAARGLPVVDAVPGASIDPYMRVCVVGQAAVAETVKRQKDRNPTFDLEAVLPVFDCASAVLQLELWDTNSVASDELVSTAELFVGEALQRQGGGTAFSGWLPLNRCESSVLDVSAGLAVASAGVVSAARSLRGLVTSADKDKAKDKTRPAASPAGGEAMLEFCYVPFAPLGDGSGETTSAPPHLPAGFEIPATDRVLSVRLLRAEDLRPPTGWGRPEPTVELRCGAQKRSSAAVPGLSPAWHELHEFVLDIEVHPRLHLTVFAGSSKASAVDAMTGALGSAANIATLGVLSSSSGADELRLRGRTGGVLGRVPACAADAEVPESFDPAFCGRAVVDLRDIERRCALAGGPVCDALPLRDAVAGSLVCVFELRRLMAPMTADDARALAAVAAAPPEGGGALPKDETAALSGPTPAPSRREGEGFSDEAVMVTLPGAPQHATVTNGETAHKPKAPQLTAPNAPIKGNRPKAARFSCFSGSE